MKALPKRQTDIQKSDIAISEYSLQHSEGVFGNVQEAWTHNNLLVSESTVDIPAFYWFSNF
ncbi:MAG TPA: hypothetical protein VNW49_03980 [Puia sp.]|nr:hypothetical protein [Puia sp.]